MSWRCDTCGGNRAIYDTTNAEPQLVGCLHCDGTESVEWQRLVLQDDRGEIAECVATVSTNWGRDIKRCGRTTHIGALCHRHFPQGSRFWDLAARYFLHLGPRGLPDTYRRVFRWALEDAGAAISSKSDEREAVTRANKARKPSVVYFVEREGLIKIGTTTDLKGRLNNLGKGGSMPPGMTVGPVKLLASTRGTRVEEFEYHQKFRKQRIAKTEWFRPCKSLWREIETIQRTGVDVLAEIVRER